MMNNKWLVWFVWGLTVLIFTVFYVRDESLAYAHISSVRFAFYQVMLLEAVVMMAVIGLGKRYFSWNVLDMAVLMYGFYVWNRYLMGDMVEGRTRCLVLVVMLFFIFRLLTTLTQQARRIMLNVFLGIVIIECIHGAGQLYGFFVSQHKLFRLTGSFFNPGPYSGLLAMALPVALSRVLRARKTGLLKSWPHSWAKGLLQAELLMAWVCLLLILWVLPAGMSRSSWLAGLMGCGVVVACHFHFFSLLRRWGSIHRKKLMGCVLLGSVILALGAGGLYHLKKDSADGRRLIWKVSLLAMREQPWIGVGLGHWGGAYGRAQSSYFASGDATPQEEKVAGVPEYGFNEYLQTAVELGLIGLLLFLTLVGIALWQLSVSRQMENLGIKGALIAFLIFAFFSYPLSVLPLVIVFVLLLALADPGAGRHQIPSRGIVGMIAGGVFLITLVNVLPVYSTEKEAYQTWLEEKSYYNMKIFEGTADNYGKLYPVLKENPRYLFEYGRCLAKTEQYEQSSQVLLEATTYCADPMLYNILGKNAQAQGKYEVAAAYFLQAAQLLPNRLYPLYLLTNLYFETDQEQKGRAMAEELLQKKPKVPSEAAREMKEEIKEKLYEIDME